MKITVEWEYVLDSTGRDAREPVARANGIASEPVVVSGRTEPGATEESVWFFVEPVQAAG